MRDVMCFDVLVSIVAIPHVRELRGQMAGLVKAQACLAMVSIVVPLELGLFHLLKNGVSPLRAWPTNGWSDYTWTS
jgi:hypothetical protein